MSICLQSLLPETFHHLICEFTLLKSNVKGNRIGQKNHFANEFESDAEGLAHEQGELNSSQFTSCGLNGVANAGPTSDTIPVNSTASISNGMSAIESSNCSFAAANGDGATMGSVVHILVDQNHASEECMDETDMSCTTTELAPDSIAFKAKLRVNVTSTEELEIWRKEFADRSKTTMRFANTGVCTGRKTLFKVILHYLAVEHFVCPSTFSQWWCGFLALAAFKYIICL